MKRAIASPPPLPTGNAAERLTLVRSQAAAAAAENGHRPPTLIAVSKTHDREAILPFLDAGHRQFGENRVQEAAGKWPELKAEFPDVTLHMIGQLQSNKAEDAVLLFDAIHSVDRPSLIRALAKAMDKTGRHPALLVQVNLGEEPQKGGVPATGLPDLLHRANDAGLAVTGLMTVPPLDRDPAPYFALLRKLAQRHGLPDLSMGMSHDYDIAARLGSTMIRVGTSLFGAREKT